MHLTVRVFCPRQSSIRSRGMLHRVHRVDRVCQSRFTLVRRRRGVLDAKRRCVRAVPHTQVSTQQSSLTHVTWAATGGDGSDGSNWGSRPSVTRAPFTVRSAGSSSSLAHGMGAGRAHTSIGAHAVGAVKVRFGSPQPSLTH